jgi:hypothetical protein
MSEREASAGRDGGVVARIGAGNSIPTLEPNRHSLAREVEAALEVGIAIAVELSVPTRNRHPNFKFDDRIARGLGDSGHVAKRG